MAQEVSKDINPFLIDLVQEFGISNLTVVSSYSDEMMALSATTLLATLRQTFMAAFVLPDQYFDSFLLNRGGTFDSPTFFHDPINSALPSGWSLGQGEVFLPFDQDLDLMPRRLDSKLYLYKYDEADQMSLHESYAIANQINITQPIGHWSKQEVFLRSE